MCPFRVEGILLEDRHPLVKGSCVDLETSDARLKVGDGVFEDAHAAVDLHVSSRHRREATDSEMLGRRRSVVSNSRLGR